jgi:hypothetical protein
LEKQRDNLQRILRRLNKVGYKSKLKTAAGKFKVKDSKSKLTGYKKDIKYLKKITTLARFETKPKSLAGRKPKN